MSDIIERTKQSHNNILRAINDFHAYHKLPRLERTPSYQDRKLIIIDPYCDILSSILQFYPDTKEYDFVEIIFDGDIFLKPFTFNKPVIFYNCIFKGQLFIANINFKNQLIFNTTRFKKSVSFLLCNMPTLQIIGSVFYGDTHFTNCNIDDFLLLSLSKFNEQLHLTNVESKAINLMGNTCYKTVSFNLDKKPDKHLYESITIEQNTFGMGYQSLFIDEYTCWVLAKVSNHNAINIYKNIALAHNNKILANQMHSAEMHKYHQELKAENRLFSSDGILLFFNWVISNYGLSWSRAVIATFIITYFFFVVSNPSLIWQFDLYLKSLFSTTIPDCFNVWQSLCFTIQKIFLALGIYQITMALRKFKI